MKTLPIVLILATANILQAQTKPQVVERGPHYKTWQWETPIERPDGKTEVLQHGYVEVGSGICRWDGKEEKWVDASEVIEAFPGGAIGRSAQMQATFAPNLNTFGAIDTLAPDGNRIQSHILGLAFYDLAAQKSVMIAEVKDCAGAVLPPNQVIYRDAFDGNVLADVIYTYRLGSFHQDVVLRSQLPVTPEDFGLSSDTTVLEVWTEMVSGREPQRVPQPAGATLRAKNNPGAPAVEMVDDELDFGTTRLVAGRAFSTDSRAAANSFADDALPVFKKWVAVDVGRKCLVEQVAYGALRDQVAKALPQAKVAPPEQRAAVQPRRAFPTAPQHAQANRPAQPMQMAALKPALGFVIDYEMVNSGSGFVFKGDTTFCVSNILYLTNAVFEGGAVIKGTSSGYLRLRGSVDCQTSPWRPVVFTSMDDDSVGETISGSSGNPYAASKTIAHLYIETNAALHDMRFLFTGNGILAVNPVSLTNVQFRQCTRALREFPARFEVKNMLVSDCEYAVNYSTGSTSSIEHATFDRVKYLVSSSSGNIYLTNCLLTAVSNYIYYTGVANVVLTNGVGIYQTVGGGEHYLATNSPYRDNGTTNISAEMQTALKSLTTYPPILLNNSITADTVLSSQAGRDTDLPDIGYHYAPLDFFVSAVTVASNATVLATNGVAIGIDYCVTNSWGFLLAPGKFLSQGSPVSMNRVVRAHNVQEKASGNPGTRACFYDGNTPGGSASTLRARFTEFGQMANDGYLIYTGTKFDAIELTHSAVYNPSLVINFSGTGTLVVGLTNTLWERGGVQLGTSTASTNKVIHGRNNLWRGVSLVFYGGNTNWTVADEIYDRMYRVTNINGSVLNYTNAWYLTNYGLSGGLGIIQLTNLTYAVGPLGDYYRPTNSLQLINKGSRTADLAQLYHFTTTTNQVKETNSLVDIGLHYVAVTNIAGVWMPIDTDGDGTPDYLEDSNGNGGVDSGETDWQNAFDAGLRVWITKPPGNSPVP